jgi:hypothetical protein
MRLSTILNPFYPLTLRERINRLGEWCVMEFVWRLPRYIVYWTVIRGTAAAAGGSQDPTTVTGVQIIEHYERKA